MKFIQNKLFIILQLYVRLCHKN